jgi:hypothetical protein
MHERLSPTIDAARGRRLPGRPRCAGCGRLVARTDQLYLGHGLYAHKACATYQRLTRTI